MGILNKVKLFFEWVRYFSNISKVDRDSYYRRYEEKIERAKSNGVILKSIKNEKESSQERCSHLKGGTLYFVGYKGYLDSDNSGENQYAVIKHGMPNGEVWVRCIRCGKWWKPRDGNPEAYAEALKFPTRNRPSSATQFIRIDKKVWDKLTEGS